MANKLMYTTNDDAQNHPSCRLQLVDKWLDTLMNESTNKNSIKVPTVVKPTKKKRYYKTLGTSGINSSMSPSSLSKCNY